MSLVGAFRALLVIRHCVLSERRPGLCDLYPKMSHVIPSQLFHDLNCDRWNCNVFSGPKKSEGTQITCDFWGRGRGEEMGSGGRGWMFAQTRAYPYSKMSHVIPSQLFHDLNCDRWNCNVFSGPKKSEGTQITCDFWGDEARGEG